MAIDLGKIRLLVADDELAIRKLIKAICMGMGLRNVVEATDGREAFSLLTSPPLVESTARRSFDLVISDWNMPNMNGIDFLRAVRANSSTKKLPFILLTAEAERDNIVAAISAGVTDYVVKPFTSEDLHDKILKALQK